ncbi:hypothetical protein GALL_191300 [mine drainage metagenome]|uniref:Uncharacterized protein n=1 Tax=mine drainage metagenome TaxID=410659 RepID=A0A1J5S435_9ZZZZ
MSHKPTIEALVIELREAREKVAKLTTEVEAELTAELRRLPAHYGYTDVDAFGRAVRAAVQEAAGTPRKRRRRRAAASAPSPVPATPVGAGLAAAAANSASQSSQPATTPEPQPEEMPPALPENTGNLFAYRDALTAQREEAMRRLNDRSTKPQAWAAWKKHLASVDEALRASQ